MTLNLKIDAEGMRKLRALIELSGAHGQQELLETALALLDWAVTQRASGRKIASVDEEEKQYQELEIPLFTRKADDYRAAKQPSRSTRIYLIIAGLGAGLCLPWLWQKLPKKSGLQEEAAKERVQQAFETKGLIDQQGHGRSAI